MSKIALHLDHIAVDGEHVTFRSPDNSANVTGLRIYTPISYENTTEVSTDYTIKETNGKTVSEKIGLFKQGAYVEVTLDTTNHIAYVQNGNYIDTIDVTLTTEGWTGTAPNITQTVNATGITAESYPDPVVKYPNSVTKSAKKQIDKAAALLTKMVTANGTVTFTACDTPATEITITLKEV